MRKTMYMGLVAAVLLSLPSFAAHHLAGEGEDGWVTIFDGKTFDGWKKSKEKPESFVIKDGLLSTIDGRSHLFYTGGKNKGDFKNFELQMDVKAGPNSNGGIYIHTEYQAEGWPAKGYEAQVNNTHKDWRKTGGLYAIVDVKKAPAKDDEWFHYYIKVDGKRIVIKINGKTTVDYTEPDDVERDEKMKGRVLSHGLIALQAHDPGSKVDFKNIKIKALP